MAPDAGGAGVWIGEAVRHVLGRLRHAFEDGAADQLRDLRDYRVSEGVELIFSQPSGNPIMPSTHEGHGIPLNRCDKCVCFPKRKRRWMHGEVKSPRSRLSDAIGVGNKPCPVTSVRGTNGERWNAVPLRIVPDRGQRSENVAEPSIQQLWAVFQRNPLRSKLANEAEKFPPQSASFSFKAKAGTARRKILAGESATDGIDGNSIGSKSVTGQRPNIIIAGDIGPVLRQHTAREFFDLAEGDRLKAASAFKPKAEPSDAAEKIEYAQLLHLLALHRSKPSRTITPALIVSVGMIADDFAAGCAGVDVVGGSRNPTAHVHALLMAMAGAYAAIPPATIKRLTKRLQFGEGGGHCATSRPFWSARS